HLHRLLEHSHTPRLEQESRFLEALAQMIVRHADDRPRLRPVGREHESVKRARDYIETHYADDVSLDRLAGVAYLSPFHLIRVFSHEVGIPPHTYLTQVRVQRAKSLLTQGWPIARVAAETGFVDQSHLSRHFKRNIGVTPGQYRNFCSSQRHIEHLPGS
ncbi:MAG: AraC family transcriptional regulator, partial [Chloroflexota bacterium]